MPGKVHPKLKLLILCTRKSSICPQTLQSTLNMVRTVIFDMDGVIIDSEPIHMEIQQTLFQEFDITLSPEEYQSFIGRSSKNMWQELIQRFSLKVTVPEVLLKDKEKYHEKLRNLPGLAAIDGVTNLIDELQQRNIALVLASSSSHESINLVLSLFQLDRYFKHRISGADLKWSKPHPQIFQEAAIMVDSLPDECVVIEDSKHGVSAAKSANMHCVGFQNLNSGNQDLTAADLIITDFRELTTEIIMDIGGKELG